MQRLLRALVAASVMVPSATRADGGEWSLAASAHVSGLHRESPSDTLVLGAQASAWYGLNEWAWLQFAAGAFVVPSGGGAVLGEQAAGVVLAFDVLRLVPFLELGVGLNEHERRISPMVRLGLGADYFVTSAMGVGLVLHHRAFSNDPTLSRWPSLGLRVSFRPGG